MDNWKLEIKAADCEYVNSELLGFTEVEKSAYLHHCIDVAGGEKAELRISSPWTSFNITNSAEFENIEFRGDDLFANATFESSMMDQWNLLAFMPWKKCNVRDNAGELTTLDELHVETLNYAPIQGFEYTCEPSFNKTAKLPPNDIDQRCFTPEYIVNANSAGCTGDPYDTNFFKYSSDNNQFMKRHKTLFNLYAFDQLRTKNTKAPQLKIINCEFKFFVNTLNSLIQVETNNLGYIGTEP